MFELLEVEIQEVFESVQEMHGLGEAVLFPLLLGQEILRQVVNFTYRLVEPARLRQEQRGKFL